MEKLLQVRSIETKFETREENGTPHISGYFAVCDQDYEISPDMSESIKPGAFSRVLSKNADIRALINHDSTLVVGRTTATTLILRQDSIGLWGDIAINPNDSDAMNAWERVKRRDVTQCSFGMYWETTAQEPEYRNDGHVHWFLTDIDLFEVSICTFPAYEATNISAREKQRDAMKARELSAWKNKTKERIRHGA